jgi:hypothetical protein
MQTVTVKFVVKDQATADSLMNEISEDIGNNAGFPYIYSDISPSSLSEIQAYKEMMKEIENPESR